MNKKDVPAIAKHFLSEYLDQPGSLLYSAADTLKEGTVYLMGFNPGGSNGVPLKDSINELASKTTNSYLDEEWSNGGGSYKAGEAPLQQRVRWVLETLKQNPRDVCASNLIFLQSVSAGQINYDLAEICWPVHEAILSIVKPEVILVYGNSSVSPYGFLYSRFGGEQEYLSSGHGEWSIKSFRCEIGGQNVVVAGLPHLSRYKPMGKGGVKEWLEGLL